MYPYGYREDAVPCLWNNPWTQKMSLPQICLSGNKASPLSLP